MGEGHMRNILCILAGLMGFGVFGQTNIPTRQMLVDTNGVVKWPTNITSITIGGNTFTNLTGFGLSISNGQLSVDTTQLPEGSGGSSLVTSVSDDFEVTAGALALTNALGTGPLVRQSEAGVGSGTMTGIAFSVTAPFAISPTSTTTSNTFTLSISNQSANLVYAGPTTGADAAPTFRALVDADVPDDITVDLAAVATVANSGDSATAFFSSGEIEDARLPSGLARDSEVSATYAPLASPALTGSPTVNGTNLMDYAGSHLTEAEASALYQGTNANLTTLAGASITGSGNFMRTRTGVPREIWIPANAMTPTSEPPTASTNTWATTTDGQLIEAWDFSASTTNALNWTLALPLAWDGGTVKAKVAWKQVVAEATSTNVWAIGGGSVSDGETAGATLGTLVTFSDIGANDTNVVSITSASAAITIGGTPSAGHLTWFTIRRHPGDAGDNSSVLARLIGVHLQYTETSTEPSAW